MVHNWHANIWIKNDKMVLEKLDIHVRKNKVYPYLISYKKLTSKWTRTLNVRLKAIKLLEKNREMFYDIELCSDFLNVTTKAQATKAKIGKWDYIKLKMNCTSKGTSWQWKSNLWNGRTYLQIIYLIRG